MCPDLDYKAVPGFFKPPPGEYPGETQGVATNSKGDVFVFLPRRALAPVGI